MDVSTGFSPGEMRTILLTITSYKDKSLKGMLKNPFFGGERKFSGTLPFLLMIEELLDGLDGRMPADEECHARSEKAAPEPLEEAEDEAPLMVRFALRILFRQNASWQGTICWLDKKTEAQFRSVLELLILMDGAMSETAAAHIH